MAPRDAPCTNMDESAEESRGANAGATSCGNVDETQTEWGGEGNVGRLRLGKNGLGSAPGWAGQ
jgi:hypothetical protein